MFHQVVNARLDRVEYERITAISRKDPAMEALTAIHDKILDGMVAEGMHDLLPLLQGRRLRSSEPAWTEFVGMCLAHPLRELVHQDPFTYRTFSKPRGYAGDAVMLDY